MPAAAPVLLLLATYGLAQDTPAFHAGVSLVHVDAQVTRNSRVLSNLTKDDFRVADNGRPQDILNFSVAEEPLDLVVVFDTSASMRPAIEQVASAARLGLVALRPGDQVAVAEFDNETRKLTPFLRDFDAVERAMYAVLDRRFAAGTRILKAAQEVLPMFAGQPRAGRRRAVLMITDNLGVRDRPEGPIVRGYWEQDVVLSALRTGGDDLNPLGLLAMPLRAGINGVVEQTGGEMLSLETPGSFAEAMRRLRLRYTLYYTMPAGQSGVQRKVEVRLAPETARRFPSARVRARKGYIVP